MITKKTIEKKMSKKQSVLQAQGKRNYWKLIAIFFTGLFVVLLIVGLVREFHFRSSFHQASSYEVKLARDVVSADLKTASDDINNYDVHIVNSVKRVENKESFVNVIQVSLNKDSVSQIYLVDVGSKKIVMHSKTEFYDGFMTNFSIMRRHWYFPRI